MGYQVYLDVTFKWQVSDIFQILDISIMWVRKEVGTYFFFLTPLAVLGSFRKKQAQVTNFQPDLTALMFAAEVCLTCTF